MPPLVRPARHTLKDTCLPSPVKATEAVPGPTKTKLIHLETNFQDPKTNFRVPETKLGDPETRLRDPETKLRDPETKLPAPKATFWVPETAYRLPLAENPRKYAQTSVSLVYRRPSTVY